MLVIVMSAPEDVGLNQDNNIQQCMHMSLSLSHNFYAT